MSPVMEGLKIGLGDTGCLSHYWNDPAAVDLLEALGVDRSFEWQRDARRPDGFSLDKPVLGIGIRAATPEGLMEGVEYVASAANALLPHVGGQTPQESARAIAAKLRRHFAMRPASAPLGVIFAVDDATDELLAVLPGKALEVMSAPEVQDHRPFASAIKKALASQPCRPHLRVAPR